MPGEWLRTSEAAELLGLSRARLKDLRRDGVFKLGVHFTRPMGMQIRWRRSALEEHLAGVPPARRRGKLAPDLAGGLT